MNKTPYFDYNKVKGPPSLVWVMTAWLLGHKFETADGDLTIRGIEWHGRVYVRQFDYTPSNTGGKPPEVKTRRPGTVDQDDTYHDYEGIG